MKTNRWVDQQRSTPSFVLAGKDSHDVVLESTLAQLPASLQSVSLPPSAALAVAPTSLLAVPSPTPHRASTPPARRAGTPSRTDSSALREDRVPVYEKLLQRGQLYEQHLEALRERSIQQELRRCRSVPRISAMGHNIQRDSAIEVRLRNVYDEKSKVLGFNMQILQNREKQILDKWFHPTITSKGKRSSGKANREKQKRMHEQWEFKRQQRIEELRREKIVKEMEEQRGVPDIDKRSEVLAARRREKEGMAGYTHLEAMLERDRLAKLARWEEQQQQAAITTMASPKITEYAASLHRPGDVAERLLGEAAAREQRRYDRERQRAAAEHAGMVGAQSPRAFHADELFARQQDFLQKRDEKLRQAAEAERRMHTPSINPTSDQIAARLSQSTMERLTTTPVRARTPPREVPAGRGGTGTTPGTPSGATREQTKGGGPNEGPSDLDPRLYERLQLAEARRKLRLEAARSELAAREMEQCTFTPQTTTHYYPPQQQQQRTSSDSNQPASVYDRMQQWQQRRDVRLAEQREKEEAAKMAGVTFSPAVHSQSPSALSGYASSAPSHAQHGGVMTPPSTHSISGFDDFVARQQSAARNRVDATATSESEARGMTRRAPTTPQAPTLGRERDASRAPVVLSLQRPVSAPSQADYGVSAPLRYSLTDRPSSLAAQSLAMQLMETYVGQTERPSRLNDDDEDPLDSDERV